MNHTYETTQVPLSISAKGNSSTLKQRVLILGEGALASKVCKCLASTGVLGFDPVGVLAADGASVGLCVGDVKVIGRIDQLTEIVEKYRVKVVAVCLEQQREQLPVRSLLQLKAMGLKVIDGHQFYEERAGRLAIDVLRPSVLIFSNGFRRNLKSMLLKRFTDIVAGIVGLVVLSPLFLLIAILVKLDSPGTVFYRQIRVGLKGEPYMIWKFRSMVSDAEKDGPRWAEARDPRVSRVGWWLRKLRIDEIPQLINVLKGEMSLVGPRPERPVFVQELRSQIPYYDLRHTVRPGITGWSQIRFRYGASAEDAHTKLQYDLYYVKNLSLWLDLRIIVETVRVVILGEGAR